MVTKIEKLKDGHMWWIWADNSEQKLEEILLSGARAFQAKFGQRPTVCKLNPCHVNGQQEIAGIWLEPASNVLKWDFWFGVDKRHKDE